MCPWPTSEASLFQSEYRAGALPAGHSNLVTTLRIAVSSETIKSLVLEGGYDFYSSVAQLVEQAAVNRKVVGAKPTSGAISITKSSYIRVLAFPFDSGIVG